MANMSDAFGTVEIAADSDEAVKVIIKAIRSSEDYDYNTILNSKKGKETIGVTIEDGCLNYVFIDSFTGTGRWTYEENIQKLFIWAKDFLTEDDIKLLERSYFEIAFDFTDYECGCEVFYRTIDRLIHSKFTSLDEIEFVPCEQEELDLSWGNRLQLGVEDESYLIGWLKEEEPLNVYDFLIDERESLENFWDESLEERFKKDSWKEIAESFYQGKKLFLGE